MMSLLRQIKIVLLGVLVVCVCAFVFLIGWRLFSFITAPKSPEQLERDADLEYYQRYNKFLPGEKTPEYDYRKYSMIKRDGRYFLVPEPYSSAFGFAFFWPKELDSLYRHTVSSDEAFNTKRGLAGISVFMESKRYGNGHLNLAAIAKGAEACVPEREDNPIFLWNGLIVMFRFDDSNDKDWPQICQEALNILDQVKEVKL